MFGRGSVKADRIVITDCWFHTFVVVQIHVYLSTWFSLLLIIDTCIIFSYVFQFCVRVTFRSPQASQGPTFNTDH